MPPIAIVPAAGSGRRFGAVLKLLAPVDGVPMLERTLRSLLEAGVEGIIVVTAPGVDFGGIAALGDPRVTRAVNPDPVRGMFSSIQIGAVTFSGRADLRGPVLIHPGDMPFVLPETVARVAGACLEAGRCIVPTFNGKRGHPVAVPVRLLGAIASAPADSTLADVLDAAPGGRTSLPVADPGVLRDVDRLRDL